MPVSPGSVRELAEALGVWSTFVAGVTNRLPAAQAQALIARLALLPVRSSHAVGLLGCYVHRGGDPVAIRLQLRQERPLLATTLLHELAHACEHLTAPRPQRHRCSHGSAWRSWAQSLGTPPRSRGASSALAPLRRERLKPVAVCERCGCVFQRLRRLSSRRLWLHPDCGNGRVVPLPPEVRPG